MRAQGQHLNFTLKGPGDSPPEHLQTCGEQVLRDNSAPYVKRTQNIFAVSIVSAKHLLCKQYDKQTFTLQVRSVHNPHFNNIKT